MFKLTDQQLLVCQFYLRRISRLSKSFLFGSVPFFFWMLYPPFSGGWGLLGPNPVSLWAKARVHPGWVASSSQDPYWWQRNKRWSWSCSTSWWRGQAEAATQGANCTSGALVGFSILLKDTSTCSSVPGIGTSDLPITSPPALPTELQPPHLA